MRADGEISGVETGVPVLRLHVLRFAFLLNALFLGANVIVGYRGHSGPWESGSTVAYSLWGTLALLSAVGLRYPVRMLPALLVQFTYKAFWIALFHLPGIAPAAAGLAPVMIGGVIVDLVVIPWGYVLHAFALDPPERWR